MIITKEDLISELEKIILTLKMNTANVSNVNINSVPKYTETLIGDMLYLGTSFDINIKFSTKK